MMVSVFNVHPSPLSLSRLNQFKQLTSSGRQAVLWTEPLDDAAQQDEVSSNEWGRRDDKGHCSISTH